MPFMPKRQDLPSGVEKPKGLTVDQTKTLLNAIAENPDDDFSAKAKSKLGLSDSEARAWTKVQGLPEDDPIRIKVRNKIFDKTSDALPASQEAGGGAKLIDRFKVKNLIDRDPILIQKYFETKGYDVKNTPEGLLVRQPDSPVFQPIDPDGIDRFDLFDIVGDSAEAVITGLATGAKALGLLGAPVTGGGSLAVASALGGTATAGFETAKQATAKALGMRESFDPSRIAQAGIIGAAAPGVGKVAEKSIRFLGKGLKGTQQAFQKRKPNAKEIEDAAELLGIEPTPGTLTQSEAVRKAEVGLAGTPFLIPGAGRGVRKKALEMQTKVKDLSNNIVDSVASQRNLEIGDAAKTKLVQRLNERLKPAEEIYDSVSSQLKEIPVEEISQTLKPKLPSINGSIDQLIEETFDEGAESGLKKLSKQLEKVGSIDDLSTLRTRVLRNARTTTNPDLKYALNEVANKMRDVRSESLKELLPEAAEQISEADAIWKGVAQDVQKVFFDPTKPFKGSVRSAVDRIVEKTPSEQAVRKLLKTGDFRQMQKFQRAFPEAFEELRTGAVDDLVARSMTRDQNVDVTKLTKILGKMSKESQNLIFGEAQVKKIKALQLVIEETPALIRANPSRLREIMFDLYNPVSWKKATVDQIGNFLKARIVGLSNSKALKALGKAGEALQKVSPGQATAISEFGLRQTLPAPSNPNTRFNIPEERSRSILPPAR